MKYTKVSEKKLHKILFVYAVLETSQVGMPYDPLSTLVHFFFFAMVLEKEMKFKRVEDVNV